MKSAQILYHVFSVSIFFLYLYKATEFFDNFKNVFFVILMCVGISIIPLILLLIFNFNMTYVYFIGIFLEELIKYKLAKYGKTRKSSFYYSSIFGMYEFIIFRNINFIVSYINSNETSLEKYRDIPVYTMPLVMHLLTSEIYSISIKKHAWYGFLFCLAIHAIFNEATIFLDRKIYGYLYFSIPMSIYIIISIAFIVIYKKYLRESGGNCGPCSFKSKR